MINAIVYLQNKGIYTLIVYALLSMLCSCSTDTKVKKPNADKSKSVESEEKQIKMNAKRIVFFGNSLTAGYRLDEEESFPSRIQEKLDSLDLAYVAVNAGLSGETTAGGVRRIDWVLKQEMDIFFLELGGNDMLRGTDLPTTKANLKSIIEKVRTEHPTIPIILAGMLAPPNLGKEYTEGFAQIYPDLAKEYNLILIPFFLEGVAGVPDLILSDGIHPNASGQKIVAENIWKVLFPILKN